MKARSAIDLAARTGALDPTENGARLLAGSWFGASIATAATASALRHPFRTAVVDDHGSIDHATLDRRSTHLARALRRRGVGSETSLGLACRNHRAFVETVLAASKLGARVVYLNPSLPPDQQRAVAAAETIDLVVADEGAWTAADDTVVVRPGRHDWWYTTLPRPRTLAFPAPPLPPRPRQTDRPVILTSGTTGVPRGTHRTGSADALRPTIAILERIPFRRGEIVAIPAPLFHAWGLSQLQLTLALGGTVVLAERFDPDALLQRMVDRRVTALAAVPVMLNRLLAVDSPERIPTLRITATSGSALPGELALRWMDRFGDHLYNLYGSTEIGQISIATPEDLRADPRAAGVPVPGVDVVILDDEDLPTTAAGAIGRIAVRTPLLFDGYTGGGGKERVGDHSLVGDRGCIDAAGRLIVTGRADDLVITGGENVEPSTVEMALLRVDGVTEVAVIGRPDPDLGQRLCALVVGDDGAGDLVDRLRAAAADTLAPHERPREILLVDALPRTASGKVRRPDLPALADSAAT